MAPEGREIGVLHPSGVSIGERPVYMALYVDESGEELGEWEEGRLEGRDEVLEQLVFSLGDHVRTGALTLTAAVAIHAAAAEMTEEDSAAVLCEFWAELMVARLEYDR